MCPARPCRQTTPRGRGPLLEPHGHRAQATGQLGGPQPLLRPNLRTLSTNPPLRNDAGGGEGGPLQPARQLSGDPRGQVVGAQVDARREVRVSRARHGHEAFVKPLHHWRIQFSPQIFMDAEKVPGS
eukprot:9482508-Pyramimonas_sp.AAC.1